MFFSFQYGYTERKAEQASNICLLSSLATTDLFQGNMVRCHMSGFIKAGAGRYISQRGAHHLDRILRRNTDESGDDTIVADQGTPLTTMRFGGAEHAVVDGNPSPSRRGPPIGCSLIPLPSGRAG